MSAALELSMDATEARAITDQIKVGVEAVWHLITRAYTERAWTALGYKSWDDYCTREFGTSRLRLPREERSEVVSSLRESGLSIRAIASATNEPVMTVQNELSRVRNRTPEHRVDAPAEVISILSEDDGELADNLTEALIADSANNSPCRDCDGYGCETCFPDETITAASHPDAKPITGIDGKTYKPKPAVAPKEPRRKPITEAYDNASYDLRRVIERVVRLVDDDRFKKNKDQISGCNLSDLIRVRDALNGVIQQIEG